MFDRVPGRGSATSPTVRNTYSRWCICCTFIQNMQHTICQVLNHRCWDWIAGMFSSACSCVSRRMHYALHGSSSCQDCLGQQQPAQHDASTAPSRASEVFRAPAAAVLSCDTTHGSSAYVNATLVHLVAGMLLAVKFKVGKIKPDDDLLLGLHRLLFGRPGKVRLCCTCLNRTCTLGRELTIELKLLTCCAEP